MWRFWVVGSLCKSSWTAKMTHRLIVALMIVFTITRSAQGSDRPVRFECRGLEAYEIAGTYNIDWAYGNIRAKNRSVVVGFSLGPMVDVLVPTERPSGFRTFHVERLNKVRLSHGHNVRKNEYQATLLGAPMDGVVNLVGSPKDRTRLLAIARALADSPCRETMQRSPSN